MKNKYQDALINLVHCKSITKCKECHHKHLCTMERDSNILQELVDKETPMKVVKWKLAQPETRCAKCGAGLERYHDYCWGCGRKVDWSDINE